MKGIKRHSRKDRRQVVEMMIPLIQKKFGDNLIGLAYDGSMGRDEDSFFSDVELIAYLKEMPEEKCPKMMVKIMDGMLVEFEWTTKAEEIKKVREISEDWYIAGSDFQKAIINEQLISEINNYKTGNIEKKCRIRAATKWYNVQESTCKLLNAIDQNNFEGVPLLFFDVCLQMLIVLSFLNAAPYTTFAKFITQARKFDLKPSHFGELLDMLVKGEYTDFDNLERIVGIVFDEFEIIFEKLGIELYYSDLDPNLPHKDYWELVLQGKLEFGQ